MTTWNDEASLSVSGSCAHRRGEWGCGCEEDAFDVRAVQLVEYRIVTRTVADGLKAGKSMLSGEEDQSQFTEQECAGMMTTSRRSQCEVRPERCMPTTDSEREGDVGVYDSI